MEQKIKDTLKQYRTAAGRVWCEDTASPKLRPVAGKPLSTGQCSATALVLRDVLTPRLPDGSLKLVLGAVYRLPSMKPLIPLHVWLQYYDDPYGEPLVIDITADQSLEIPDLIICSTSYDLTKRGLLYYPQNFMAELKQGTHERAKLLESLLDNQYAI